MFPKDRPTHIKNLGIHGPKGLYSLAINRCINPQMEHDSNDPDYVIWGKWLNLSEVCFSHTCFIEILARLNVKPPDIIIRGLDLESLIIVMDGIKERREALYITSPSFLGPYMVQW